MLRLFRKKNPLYQSMPQIVYGGVDGTISTFAVIAGAYGGNLGYHVVLILGLSSLFADGFSMAVGAYLSAESAHSKQPLKASLSSFISFVSLGSLLLIPYLVGVIFDFSNTQMFVGAAIFACISFSIIGSMKALAEGTNRLRGVLEVVLLGALAAGIAYLIGHVIERLVV